MKILIILFFMLAPFIINAQGSTCAGATNLGTPTTATTCVNPTDFAQNAGGMCTGTAGMGYSNYYYKFCTDASNTCVNFNINVSSSAEWMAALYTAGCALVGGSVICNTIGGGSTGGAGFWSTAGNDPGVNLTTANTCYVLRMQVNDAYASSLNFCYYAEVPPNDACAGAIGIDATPDNYNNACATEGATDPAPAQLCAGSLENTVWYQFTAANPCGSPCNVVITTANIDCAGGGEGFQIGYFSGTCGSLTNLGCANGSGGSVSATLANATPGASYYVALDGNGGANCYYDISATNTVLLPVEMIYFRGEVDDKRNAQIQWKTASENHTSHFQVMRSHDAIKYDLVGSVSAQNIVTGGEYRLNDSQKLETGVTYYKLVQFDLNGSSKEYDPVAIVAKASIEDVTILPNPVNDEVSVFFNATKSGQANMVITNMLGQVVVDKSIDITNGGNSLQFDFSEFQKGLYFGRIYMDNDVVSLKFIK